MSLQDTLERMRNERVEYEISMGLVTADLRGRYWYWKVMMNAHPRHFRWDYHPHSSFGIWEAEPWA